MFTVSENVALVEAPYESTAVIVTVLDDAFLASVGHDHDHVPFEFFTMVPNATPSRVDVNVTGSLPGSLHVPLFVAVAP